MQEREADFSWVNRERKKYVKERKELETREWEVRGLDYGGGEMMRQKVRDIGSGFHEVGERRDFRENLFTIFLDNLNPKVDHRSLWEIFMKYGMVRDVFISSKKSARSSSFAFVRFESLKEATMVVKQTYGLAVHGWLLRTNVASYDWKNRKSSAQSGLVSKVGGVNVESLLVDYNTLHEGVWIKEKFWFCFLFDHKCPDKLEVVEDMSSFIISVVESRLSVDLQWLEKWLGLKMEDSIFVSNPPPDLEGGGKQLKTVGSLNPIRFIGQAVGVTLEKKVREIRDDRVKSGSDVQQCRLFQDINESRWERCSVQKFTSARGNNSDGDTLLSFSESKDSIKEDMDGKNSGQNVRSKVRGLSVVSFDIAKNERWKCDTILSKNHSMTLRSFNICSLSKIQNSGTNSNKVWNLEDKVTKVLEKSLSVCVPLLARFLCCVVSLLCFGFVELMWFWFPAAVGIDGVLKDSAGKLLCMFSVYVGVFVFCKDHGSIGLLPCA
ncbi:hypothetical protein Ddye_024357 [Dipteronia dyeriana]|uniref:RRM domain-containing protein n=1 Tax=Dipteronia dyeriana TaxID=168575 RepID=A0AAD9TUQ7_9ROSI|nr:hypothetical protein Ddye_024357 [Dipteronia dyeriana]